MRKKLLLVIVLGVATVCSIPINLSCSKYGENQTCIIENIVLDSKTVSGYKYPAEQTIKFNNCSFDYFSPEEAARISVDTKELGFWYGSLHKAYLKPSLKSFTALYGGVEEIEIDAEDNFNLEVLDIGHNLRAVPNNVKHLKNLVVLDLCENRIETVDLDQFQDFSKLRKLNLGHNKIKTVDLTERLYLPALEELYLHGNQLSTLDFTHLDAPNLRGFYVSQNQLVQIEGFPVMYPRLVRTDLYLNKWNCDWLKKSLTWLDEAGVETLSYLPLTACNETGTVKVAAIACKEI